MPTYEYVCEKCGETFDYFQSMKDPRLEVCILDGCDGKVKRKLGTGAGIIFKGSGFYETDYRSESYKSAAKKDTAASSSSGGDSGKKSAKTETKKADAKPAASGSGSSAGGGSKSD